MNNLSDILKKKQSLISDKGFGNIPNNKRPINVPYEVSKEISKYVDINIFVIRKWISVYGEGKVRGLCSFLKDYPNLDKKRAIGLSLWYLKRKNT